MLPYTREVVHEQGVLHESTWLIGGVNDHATPGLCEHTGRQPFEYRSPPQDLVSFTA